jgi:hypothetical protein
VKRTVTHHGDTADKQESGSFLKKRTKKLLRVLSRWSPEGFATRDAR